MPRRADESQTRERRPREIRQVARVLINTRDNNNQPQRRLEVCRMEYGTLRTVCSMGYCVNHGSFPSD